MTVEWIIGLGNPGDKYKDTRHNAGFWLVDELARRYNGSWRYEKKFFGHCATIRIDGKELRLLKPETFMNLSGQAVQAAQQFYKLTAAQMLVVHDELDLDPGAAKLKRGGGHGGHNGLRDTSARLGNEYLRLRLGIGHPGHRDQVVSYVLKRPSAADQAAIDLAISNSADVVPILLSQGLEKAMNRLHSA